MVHQNLVALVGAGTFTGDAEKGVWATGPCWALVRPTMEFFEESAAISPGEGRIYRFFLVAVQPRLEKAGQVELAALVARRLAELGGPPE